MGSSSLMLYQTRESERQIWVRQLPKPAKIATFSYNASLIASTGWHDRLIKLWKRQSFGSDVTRFNFTYLAHPTTVTAICWRKPLPHKHHPHEENVDDVLFSICADNKIRIWAATDPHGLQGLQLWAEIDMQQSIQSRRLADNLASTERFAFFIDKQDFTYAADSALQTESHIAGKESHSLEHLSDVLKARPDVCVVFDRQGNMSAWGIQNVGCKARKPTDIFNIAHIDDLQIPFLLDAAPEEKQLYFFGFYSDPTLPAFTLMSHFFDGRLTWHETRLTELFDPSPRPIRLQLKAVWTGHEGIVRRMIHAANGKALMSYTSKNKCLLWTQDHDQDLRLLQRRSCVSCTEDILGICILDIDYVIILQSNKISLWNTNSCLANEVSCHKLEAKKRLSSLLLVAGQMVRPDTYYVAAITSAMSGSIWEIKLPAGRNHTLVNGYDQTPSMTKYCLFEGILHDETVSIQPIDLPSAPMSRPNLSRHSPQNVAISHTDAGTIYTWAAKVTPKISKVWWYASSSVQTCIPKPSLVSGGPIQKVALVDAARTGLSIWDTQSTLVEYDKTFNSFDTISGLCWSSTSDLQAILAVNFSYKVNVLTQRQYDHINASPAWALIREINIKDLTSHPISDSVWLGSGDLVVAAGNQLFVYDKLISMTGDTVTGFDDTLQKTASLSIFDLTSYLNRPLPVYDPIFLSQCILAGKSAQVYHILIVLHKALKYFTEDDELDSHLSLTLSSFYVSECTADSSSSLSNVDEDQDIVFEELMVSLIEHLAMLTLPHLAKSKQLQLANLIECTTVTEKYKRALDENATIYYHFFSESKARGNQAYVDQSVTSWREIAWAFHSGCQDILIDLVSRQFSGSMVWENARCSGMFSWITDLAALV